MTAEIILVETSITRSRLREIASWRMGDLVKAVVDIEKGIMAVGGELHADEEAFLIERECSQDNLWGINIYPDLPEDKMLEFDSVINIRPRQDNRSRSVENEKIKTAIREVVNKLIQGD